MGAINVVYMGTPDFAVAPLRALAQSYNVVGVYTRPDAVSKRGNQLHPSPVKVAAQEFGISVFTPTTLRTSEAVADLVALSPDVIVVAAYGMILLPEVLSIPRFGCINLHASLLPRWRGAAPIQRAILSGDKECGVCVMKMEEGLDTGPYCGVSATLVGSKSTVELTAELSDMAARLLMDTVPSIISGSAQWISQDEAHVTYATKMSKDELIITPSLTVQDGVRRVHASSEQAPARLTLAGIDTIVVEACLEVDLTHTTEAASGTIVVTKNNVYIGLADGFMELVRVKPSGKPLMRAADYARGARLETGATWQ